MPPRVNADDRRRTLVAHAAELFDRAGYHTTNVAALAEAAGLRKPTLYHYFSSKDELLHAIHEEFIDLLLEQERARPALEPEEHLRAIVTDVLSLMETHRGHVRVFFEHHRELSQADRDTIREKRDAYYELVKGVVARGQREGRFRQLDASLVTLALFGMCNWAYQWFRADGPRSSAEIADVFVGIVLDGIRR